MHNLQTKGKIDSVFLNQENEENHQTPTQIIIFQDNKAVACFETESFEFENLEKLLQKYKMQFGGYSKIDSLFEYWNTNSEGIEVSYK